MTALTPYDTGTRLEPRQWVRSFGVGAFRELFVGSSEPRKPVEDDFGKVDFDDDGGTTVLTIHVERRKHGGYRVVIDTPTDAEVAVRLNEGDDLKPNDYAAGYSGGHQDGWARAKAALATYPGKDD